MKKIWSILFELVKAHKVSQRSWSLSRILKKQKDFQRCNIKRKKFENEEMHMGTFLTDDKNVRYKATYVLLI